MEQAQFGRCDGVGSGGQRQSDPFFISLLLARAKRCRCLNHLSPSGIDRGTRLPPRSSRRLPAMTGKALFRRVAAERRHGDLPGNGEGPAWLAG
jgi:hypothetical protein